MSPLNNSRIPILCYVTDRRSLSAAGALDSHASVSALSRRIETIVSAGIDWVQIREKDLSARDLSKLTREAMRLAKAEPTGPHGRVRVLVNHRLDVALAERASGVHLGEHSLPAKEAKQFAEAQAADKGFLVGTSCHSLEGAKATAQDGSSYIFFGPVFATPSKAAFGAPQGLEQLAEVCGSLSIPVLAIGGICLENAAACFAAGASGIAAIRLFQDSPDPAATIAALRQLAR